METNNSTILDGVIVRCVEEKPMYVRYKNGAKLYSMSVNQFTELAKDAGAIYKINRMVLVNCEEFENYLKYYRLET